jgi:hypothetical protein
MTWEEAVRLVDRITANADSGNWHTHVAAVEQSYAVAVRQHNTSTSYYVSSFQKFIALCDHLMTPGH